MRDGDGFAGIGLGLATLLSVAFCVPKPTHAMGTQPPPLCEDGVSRKIRDLSFEASFEGCETKSPRVLTWSGVYTYLVDHAILQGTLERRKQDDGSLVIQKYGTFTTPVFNGEIRSLVFEGLQNPGPRMALSIETRSGSEKLSDGGIFTGVIDVRRLVDGTVGRVRYGAVESLAFKGDARESLYVYPDGKIFATTSRSGTEPMPLSGTFTGTTEEQLYPFNANEGTYLYRQKRGAIESLTFNGDVSAYEYYWKDGTITASESWTGTERGLPSEGMFTGTVDNARYRPGNQYGINVRYHKNGTVESDVFRGGIASTVYYFENGTIQTSFYMNGEWPMNACSPRTSVGQLCPVTGTLQVIHWEDGRIQVIDNRFPPDPTSP